MTLKETVSRSLNCVNKLIKTQKVYRSTQTCLEHSISPNRSFAVGHRLFSALAPLPVEAFRLSSTGNRTRQLPICRLLQSTLSAFGLVVFYKSTNGWSSDRTSRLGLAFPQKPRRLCQLTAFLDTCRVQALPTSLLRCRPCFRFAGPASELVQVSCMILCTPFGKL